MRRKILSLVLALCMVISLLPMTAFAAGDDTTPAETYTVTVKQTGVGEEGSETYGTVKVTGDSITETSSTNGTDTTISSVASGTLLTIEVIAPTGSDGITYAVKEVKAGDNVLKANADGKFTHPVTSDVTIAVTYKQVFAIDVAGAASSGSKVEADVEAAAGGETVTLTVTPATGYQLTESSLKVTYTDEGEKTVPLTSADDNKYTFIMPAADVAVTAAFEKLSYTITGTGDLTNGSVKATIGSGTEAVTKAEHGDIVKLTVTPNAGYQLNTLKVNETDVTANVSEGVYTIDAVNANIVVEATFGIKTYAVEIGSIANGSVTANPTNAAKDATVTLTVTPDTGYKLADDSLTVTQKGGSETVTLTAGTTANTYTFTMPEADVTVAATFEAIPYAITTTETGLDADENGTINITGTSVTTGDDDATTATVGNEITVAITAPTGKAVKSVTSADATVKVGATEKESENWKTTCTFTMPAKDVALEIAYETAGAYGVSVGTITGSGTVSTDKYTADKGATVTLTATPDAGYKLTALTVTPESGSGAVTLTPAEIAETGGEYTFTMPEANVTVTATFTAIDYTVTVDTESIQHGTVSASPTTANVGTTITLTVTPDENYEFGTLTVKDAGGNTIATTGSGTSYTFTMPANNVTVTATFVEAGSETPDPEPNPGGNGGGSGGGSTTPTPPPVEPDPNPPSTGEDVTQTVTPDISEGTASATVDKETADKLVSDAVDNKSENV
ncbi:MAG: hypothetical protein HFE98_10980, partial [Ruminiclostridium sp.]|nr:hypothetical protein [Ruminiclostridium sp.]